GLHVKFDRAGRLGPEKPAGWPFAKSAIGRKGMFPICVLGPMTDLQRDALDEALARYGPGGGDGEAWGR
ncbi:hypothetical protein, partial [Streptacidiphilus carbonis]|uniref:hypothetical protein n=1 Tax=Streptacidiphilus carbonis TaxID=105422 RepID=UPI001F1AB034